MKRLILLSVAAAAMTLSGCCANERCDDCDDAACTADKGAAMSVNAYCAVNPKDKVNPAIPMADWKGQKVGFCCKGCPPKWAKMTDEQKDAALATAMAKSAK